MATVELSNLHKSFGSYTALENLNLTIADGEFLVLLGPSGCGKSTTMRLVAGLEEPTSGDILIDGEYVNDIAARDRDLAMVFQNYALYPHMTVGENIGYPLKIKKVSRPEREERVRVSNPSRGCLSQWISALSRPCFTRRAASASASYPLG